MVIDEKLDVEGKLKILADAAKYDVACTSSGVDRGGQTGQVGSSCAAGICHTFAADGRCISLLKVLHTNECVFDCKYCVNRSSNDVPRATFTSEEVCELTMQFYRRNFIEGLFLSSGVAHSPDYTMQMMCQTLILLREQYHFNGYIHCKAIPGASAEMTELAGWYADRMSVNLELATADGLKALAPHKSRHTILSPMRQIRDGIGQSRAELGMKGGNRSAYWFTSKSLREQGIADHSVHEYSASISADNVGIVQESGGQYSGAVAHNRSLSDSTEKPKTSILLPDVASQKGALSMLGDRHITGRGFVPAGQSTQMIVGATDETDYHIMTVAESLYQKMDLKRVFYSAFINVNADAGLALGDGKPPLLREHRLYQADWLLRYYGFGAGDLLTQSRPNFNVFLDPKCDWALRSLEQFPVEVNKADYFTLLRVPGLGVKSAQRIVKARKSGTLSFEDLKNIGVVLKRAAYFITCSGKMMFPVKMDEDYIAGRLTDPDERRRLAQIGDSGGVYKQMTLFDDMGWLVAQG
jgi:putative DNA modification/repair radical SAM protein